MFIEAILCFQGFEATFMKTTIAVLNKKGKNAYPTIVRVLQQLAMRDACFSVASSSEVIETENPLSLEEKQLNSSIIIGSVYSRLLTRSKPQFTRIGNAVSMFEGRLYSSQEALSPLNLSEKSHSPNEKIIENLLKTVEGDFCQIITEPERILAARDSIGVQPFYYGENTNFTALATNRKALWKLEIANACSFPPGNLVSINREGFDFKPIKTLVNSKPKKITMNEAAKTLETLLERSVQIRLDDVKEVAVAFSGGLDSSVVAFLAKKCNVKVHLVHVSLRGQPETEEAKKVAEELKLPLSVHLFETDDVEKTIEKVVALIEEADPVKVAVGVPFYWIAKKTAESGLNVLLAGQGADELFGGYQRYVNEYMSCGKRKVRETMFTDVVRIHESNIERDEKICGFHDVELRLPFASYSVAEFALSLPVELKLEKKLDGLRKLVLRRVALNLGLPEIVVNKPKKAVQYATGVNSVLGKIAKKQGLTVKAYVEKVFREQKGW